MAGYSGTPLAKKLGIKEQFRVLVLDMPSGVRTELKDSLAKCRAVRDGSSSLDFAIFFVKTADDLKTKFAEISQRLAPAGMFWVGWPKKSSGVATDLNENEVRRIGLEAGLVDVKVCAIDDTWSGLKFVIRVKDRLKS